LFYGAFDLDRNRDGIKRHIICSPGLRCAAHPLIDHGGKKYGSSLPDSRQHMKEIGEDPVGGLIKEIGMAMRKMGLTEKHYLSPLTKQHGRKE
jgi:hypothetical protein